MYIDVDTQNELRHRFNPDGSLLREHQLRMLDMLLYFDSFCKEHGLKYWLSSGTLLGAVRHGGYIPWDDDTDVEMLRDDYNKLVTLMKETDDYVLQTKDNDLFYVAPYAKLRDKHSYIEEHSQDKHYKFKGIYVDVFVLEDNNYFLAKGFSILMWRILKFGSNSDNKALKILFILFKSILYAGITFARIITKILPGNKLRHTYGSGYVKNIRNYDQIFPLSEVSFEGYLFPAPGDLDGYMSNLYKDYKSLPDLDKIHLHIEKVEIYK